MYFKRFLHRSDVQLSALHDAYAWKDLPQITQVRVTLGR